MGCPNHFESGKPFQIGSLRIEPLRTPHDAIEGVCFVIEDIDSGQRFGLLTDLGHVFSGLQAVINSLDAVLIESNYDDEMLLQGPYPQHLKNRIAGKRGHISNEDAAQLLDKCQASKLQWVCLGHLSGQNTATGNVIPDYDPSADPSRHQSWGMAPPAVSFVQSPNQETFSLATHSIIVVFLGLIGSNFAMYIYRTRDDG